MTLHLIKKKKRIMMAEIECNAGLMTTIHLVGGTGSCVGSISEMLEFLCALGYNIAEGESLRQVLPWRMLK